MSPSNITSLFSLINFSESRAFFCEHVEIPDCKHKQALMEQGILGPALKAPNVVQGKTLENFEDLSF